MMESAPTALVHVPLARRGKVRDIYDLGDRLLLVASDRLSAFDVILPTPLPGKGKLLTRIAALWFEASRAVMPNHLISTSLAGLPLSPDERDALSGRAMIVRKAERIDIECVVRGYLAGSGWKEYRQAGTLAGEPLPAGVRKGDRLPEPRFTPAIKNDEGHDENISWSRLVELVGDELARTLRDASMAVFAFGSERAARAGFILADTKFEFGWIDGDLTLIDEVLTPDSSRYWDAAAYVPGEEPPAFDKQIVRDWLETTDWDKRPPGPIIPQSIVNETLDRYQAVADRLAAVLENSTDDA